MHRFGNKKCICNAANLTTMEKFHVLGEMGELFDAFIQVLVLGIHVFVKMCTGMYVFVCISLRVCL